MNLRRVLKELLVQQISVSEGKVFLLFHAQSPVQVETLLGLVKKPNSRFRLAPDGRLSFTPGREDWDSLIEEIIELLRTIHDPSAHKANGAGQLAAL
jgi:transcription-repair coupling factor (superfamily II helicase)